MSKMSKHSDVITLLVHLLQSPYAKELCRLQKIAPVKSVQVERGLNKDGSRYWKMQLALENNSFDITIEDNSGAPTAPLPRTGPVKVRQTPVTETVVKEVTKKVTKKKAKKKKAKKKKVKKGYNK